MKHWFVFREIYIPNTSSGGKQNIYNRNVAHENWNLNTGTEAILLLSVGLGSLVALINFTSIFISRHFSLQRWQAHKNI